MAKITRKHQKIFAGSATNNGVFGSAQVGTKVLSTDPDVIQGLAAFDTGWNSATISGERLPTLEEMQGLQYLQTRQIAYILQEGVAEYDATTEYHVNSIVKKAATYELYGSIINTNTGNALGVQADTANWKYLGKLDDLKNAGAAGNLTGAVTSVGLATSLGSFTSAQLATALTDETGSGANVFATSPTLVTPALGTPSALVATNATGTATGLTSGITNALKSATTTVDVSAATAPTSGQVLTATGSTAATWQAKSQVLMVQEQQTAGTNGGTFTSGSYVTRVLNTSVLNEISGASLGSNQITLPAGSYEIWASAPANQVNNNKARLRNITDSTTTLIGASAYANSGTTNNSWSNIVGKFTIAGTKVFEIQHACSSTFSGSGLGNQANLTEAEVYTQVMIRKVA